MTMNVKVLSLFVLMALSPVAVSSAFADTGYTEKLDFAAGLEETLGHFWAIEQNLDDDNAKLALVHATHPIAELYDAMKPTLVATSPSLDTKIKKTLDELGEKASTDVSRADADAAIADARAIVDMAESQVIGDNIASDTGFRLELMKTLLETSIAEYQEAISDGAIVEMAEFQDGSAFVWRAGVIFEEVKMDLTNDDCQHDDYACSTISANVSDINEMFDEVEAAYDARADPAVVAEATTGILDKIDEINSVAGSEKLDFGAGLEETRGHFWAIEQNLDDDNAKLALVHATHPIAELYDAMKPTLVATSPSLDTKIKKTLDELGEKASTDVSRADADAAIADARAIVDMAESQVIGDNIASDTGFRLELMKTLLETSIAEYQEAISDGAIVEMAEFQDGSAFVWRAGVIFSEIEADVPHHEAEEIEEIFEIVEAAYDARADPSEVATATGGLLHEIDEIKAGKIEFGAALEETRGHFWAIEQNLDDDNAKLALVHATHPIAELYDAMKPTLVATSPSLDTKIKKTLDELGEKASTDVSRADADAAIADARAIVDMAESQVIGDNIASDTGFRLELMKTLLETSIAEYQEAISDGAIVEMAEFQDGSAFVWRAGVIFEEIRDDLPHHEADEMAELFDEVEAAYDARADPSDVATLTGGILHEIDEILGTEESDEDKLQGYVNNIVDLLTRADAAYASGDSDLALSLVTKAYLDNFEFLESPLVNAGEKELMEDIEHEMREELRTMIKQGAPTSQVSSQIDTILIKMETVAVVVPEFGTIAMLVLVVSIVAVIALASRSKSLTLVNRTS